MVFSQRLFNGLWILRVTRSNSWFSHGIFAKVLLSQAGQPWKNKGWAADKPYLILFTRKTSKHVGFGGSWEKYTNYTCIT